MEFRELLRAQLDEIGIDPTELCRHVEGLNQPTVQRILSGETLNPRIATVNKINEAISRARMAYGTAPRTISPNTSPGPDLAGRVPLISWVRAGAWSEIIDNLAPGDAEEWLPCPVAHGRHTFALTVRGESMHNPHGRPSFQDGDLIFVDPEREARHGSLVVVRLDDQGEATFKRLIVEGERRFLKALNPAWPEPMLEINGNATVCGVVIFKGEVL